MAGTLIHPPGGEEKWILIVEIEKGLGMQSSASSFSLEASWQTGSQGESGIAF